MQGLFKNLSHESEAEWPEMVKSSLLSEDHENPLSVPVPSEAQSVIDKINDSA